MTATFAAHPHIKKYITTKSALPHDMHNFMTLYKGLLVDLSQAHWYFAGD